MFHQVTMFNPVIASTYSLKRSTSIDSQETLVGLSDTVIKCNSSKVEKFIEQEKILDDSLGSFFSGSAASHKLPKPTDLDSNSTTSSRKSNRNFTISPTDSSNRESVITSSWSTIGLDLSSVSEAQLPQCTPQELVQEIDSFFGFEQKENKESKELKKEKKQLEKLRKKLEKNEKKMEKKSGGKL